MEVVLATVQQVLQHSKEHNIHNNGSFKQLTEPTTTVMAGGGFNAYATSSGKSGEYLLL